MTDAQATYRQHYAEAFRAYLGEPTEAGLQDAYELGRRAVQLSLSALELADAYHEVLATELADPGRGRGAAEVAEIARGFLNETLAAFDMASRGFLQASATARLEQRHAARLQQLAEAFLELNDHLSARHIVGSVSARARRVLDARAVRVRLHLSFGDGDGEVVEVVDGDDVALADDLVRVATAERRPVGGWHEAGWSVLVAPVLRRGGRPAGVIQLVGTTGAPFSDQDEAIAVQFASMTAIAVENALRYTHAQEVAATLQRSLLPARIDPIPGARTAARYLAGGAGMEVGGDFYDVIQLGPGRVALALGDVMGKGVRAAATMGQLRMGLRAYAADGRPAAAVVAALDRLIASLRGDAFATMVYLDVALDRGEGRLVLAGHPAPVIRRPDGHTALLEGPVSPPLGLIGDDEPADLLVDVPADSLLLLYSDGLVEGRDLPVAEGMALALDAVRSGPTEPEALCDHVLAALGGRAGPDDTALLAFRSQPT